MDEEIEVGEFKMKINTEATPKKEVVSILVRLKEKNINDTFKTISEKQREELIEDIKDLGKWRKYRELKKELN